MPYARKYAVGILFALSASVNIITCLIFFHYAPATGDRLPIHYNAISGFDEIGSRIDLYQLPIFGFIVLLLNISLTWLLGKTGEFISIIAASSALLVACILLISAILLTAQT